MKNKNVSTLLILIALGFAFYFYKRLQNSNTVNPSLKKSVIPVSASEDNSSNDISEKPANVPVINQPEKDATVAKEQMGDQKPADAPPESSPKMEMSSAIKNYAPPSIGSPHPPDSSNLLENGKNPTKVPDLNQMDNKLMKLPPQADPAPKI